MRSVIRHQAPASSTSRGRARSGGDQGRRDYGRADQCGRSSRARLETMTSNDGFGELPCSPPVAPSNNGATAAVALLDERDGTSDDEDFEDELTRLALAADPDVVLGPDAVAWPEATDHAVSLLPAWYMPPLASVLPAHRRWRTAVVLLVVVGMLLINALGFCITYGNLSVA